ncbi:MAG: hypothetical protein J6P96_01315, partial [Bacteroidaceae bacterium]|nr:hypothetical protein [Bacteroidaceae bacterium]
TNIEIQARINFGFQVSIHIGFQARNHPAQGATLETLETLRTLETLFLSADLISKRPTLFPAPTL